MLKVCQVNSVHEKLDVFSRMDPRNQTWLVADLRSKLHLQKELMSRCEFLQDISILRANELWQSLVHVLMPEINIVSADFAKALIQSELRHENEEWMRRPGAVDAVYAYLESLIPLLAHQKGHEVIEEWFANNPEANWRWRHWYRLSRKLWDSFLEKNILTASWLSGVLANVDDFAGVWRRELLVDLGVHINAMEAEILLKLARKVPVTVFIPESAWTEEFESLFRTYQPIIDSAVEKERSSAAAPQAGQDRQFLKFTTMISEVKHATATVRAWLDQGIPPEKIAVTSPSLEAYWPALKMYFAKEGIPVGKGVVARCHTLPGVMRWLSDLRLRTGKVRYSDLQSRFFSERQKRILPYADFERLFLSVYGKEDLGRHAEVSRFFQQEYAPNEKMPLRDFVAWSLKFWPADDMAEEHLLPLESLCHKLFQDVGGPVELEAADWLSYLEAMASRLEFEVAPPAPGGVQFVQLFSAEYVDGEALVFLGLTDQAVRPAGRGGLSTGDANLLFKETGFRLNAADDRYMEFDGRWLLNQPFKHLLVSFPATDFAGNPQAPALIWLAEKMAVTDDFDAVLPPAVCRWDEIQLAVRDGTGKWLHSADKIVDELETDFGRKPLLPLEKGMPPRMSATGLEQYLNCPFKFAASRLFGLSDLPALDLDVDRLTRGSLMHAVFEALLGDGKPLELSDEEIMRVIERVRETEDVKVADERLWPSLKNRYLHLARQFLDFERDWRKFYLQTKTVGLEEEIKGYLDLQTGELHREEKEDRPSVPFSGSIDRVDVNGDGRAVVIDYKSSKGSLRQYGSWVKANQLQLCMYAQALENGLTSIEPCTVSAAVYYVGKGCDRETGFKMAEYDGELYNTSGSRASVIDADGKTRLYAEVNETVRDTLKSISEGLFRPEPKNQVSCDSCRWRALCRAPHLN